MISVRRGGEPSLLYLRRGSNDVRELRFPAVRPVEVQGRLTWLEQDPAGEQWLVRTGDPRSGEVTETVEITPCGLSPALISDGRRLYLATLPYDSTPVITLREVLPGGKLRTLTSRIPWFARHWVQDGLLYTVAREDRVKWWEWFRSRGGDREQWTLMRYRLPRN